MKMSEANAEKLIPHVVNEGRHILAVDDDGFTYIEGHGNHPLMASSCDQIAEAWESFESRVSYPVDTQPLLPAGGPRPGRFWCDVDEDGNFEIGAEVAE